MMPSIIAHIGPPKIGKTTLQIALEQIAHPKIYYGNSLPIHLQVYSTTFFRDLISTRYDYYVV